MCNVCCSFNFEGTDESSDLAIESTNSDMQLSPLPSPHSKFEDVQLSPHSKFEGELPQLNLERLTKKVTIMDLVNPKIEEQNIIISDLKHRLEIDIAKFGK